MTNTNHLSLEATMTSLYSPEIRFSCSASEGLVGRTIAVKGQIGRYPIAFIQAINCTPNRDNSTLIVDNKSFSFILAWVSPIEDIRELRNSISFQSLLGGLYPFISKQISLTFTGVNFPLTSSLHLEIPHYITRYSLGTEHLQHTFSEGGVRSPSYMGGICKNEEQYKIHLHYKSLDVFRRICGPALTMIAVLYLDLSAILAGGENWKTKPAVILSILSINTAAFASLAMIRVGPTLRSLLNLVRFIAVLWVVFLTCSIRIGSISNIRIIVDAGIKGCITWIFAMSIYSFFFYTLDHDEKRKQKSFIATVAVGTLLWVASLFTANLAVSHFFSQAIAG